MFFSRPSFDPAIDLLDMTGKVIIVTGGNTGIGYSTIKFLARKGAKMYMAARNESKATAAIKKLTDEDGIEPGRVVWLPLDLVDPKSVKNAAEEFKSKEKRLDVLVSNAAKLWGDYQVTKEGISEDVMVNFIGVALFTMYLLPLMQETAKEPESDVRIVTLSSDGHKIVPQSPNLHIRSIEDFNDDGKGAWTPVLRRYGLTKQYLLLFHFKLQEIVGDSITCISVHPGSVYTFEERSSELPLSFITKHIVKLLFKNIDEGSYNSCFAAASPLVRADKEKYRGVYLHPVGVNANATISENVKREDLKEEVWNVFQKFMRGLGN